MADRRSEAVAHFDTQARACAALGSPFLEGFLAALIRALDTETETGRRVLGWPGDYVADAVALRLAGGLNALARSGRAPGLAAVWPGLGGDGTGAAEAAAEAIATHDGEVARWLDGPPQTNEARRSAVLMGAICGLGWARAEVLEIGASAGLGLGFDGYRFELGDGRSWGPETAAVRIESEWRGAAPTLRPFAVEARAGCDIAPIDARDPAQRARMLAYVWPDQPARRAMLESALAHVAAQDWRVERADAAEWAAARLATPQEAGRGRVLWHSIMKQYLPKETRAALDRTVAAAGARATPARPFATVSMEADDTPGSAAVTVTAWPGGEPREVARTSFHGYWTEWTA